MEKEPSPFKNVVKAAAAGVGAGSIWGAGTSVYYDWPLIQKEVNVVVPCLKRAARLMGSYGAACAAIGGIYIGLEQVMQHFRGKEDYFNGAFGGFVAGASVMGYRVRTIPAALAAGSALAFTSTVFDVVERTTRVDNGKEHFAERNPVATVNH